MQFTDFDSIHACDLQFSSSQTLFFLDFLLLLHYIRQIDKPYINVPFLGLFLHFRIYECLEPIFRCLVAATAVGII